MNTTNFAARLGVAPRILLAVGGIASLAFTGCQVDVGGQTLPSGTNSSQPACYDYYILFKFHL